MVIHYGPGQILNGSENVVFPFLDDNLYTSHSRPHYFGGHSQPLIGYTVAQAKMLMLTDHIIVYLSLDILHHDVALLH